jgi:hypothetical protein
VSALTLVLSLVLLPGCASLKGKNRVLVGFAAGAAVGAGGGAALSPNSESRGMNALVFGLSGALVGGVAALLTDQPPAPEHEATLRERELGTPGVGRQFQIQPASELPPFVRERIQPAVVEEYLESDRISEDGELHEPHKVYRIKRPVELAPKPKTAGVRSE